MCSAKSLDFLYSPPFLCVLDVALFNAHSQLSIPFILAPCLPVLVTVDVVTPTGSCSPPR